MSVKIIQIPLENVKGAFYALEENFYIIINQNLSVEQKNDFCKEVFETIIKDKETC